MKVLYDMVALIALSIRSWHACAVRFALPLRVYCVFTQFPSERRAAALVLNLIAEAPRFCAQGSSWGPSYAFDWLPNRSQRLHCASLALPYLLGRSASAIVIADRCDSSINALYLFWMLKISKKIKYYIIRKLYGSHDNKLLGTINIIIFIFSEIHSCVTNCIVIMSLSL